MFAGREDVLQELDNRELISHISIKRSMADKIADNEKTARQLLKQRSFKEGVKLLQKVVDDQKCIGSDDQSLVENSCTQQWGYWEVDDKLRAEAVAREALDIFERTLGLSHERTMGIIKRIADNLWHQERKDECKLLHETVRSRRSDGPGQN